MNKVEEESRIEIRQPKLLTNRAVFAINAHGLLLIVPLLAAMLAVTALSLSLATVLLPLAALLLATFFLPLGFGNIRVQKLVASLGPPPAPDSSVVQLTLRPRIRSGTRAELEDADDIGYLTVTDSSLQFKGDSVTLTFPLESIETVRKRNIGMRGLFVYGARICLEVSGLPSITSLEFAERSSKILPQSRRLTAAICNRLAGGRAELSVP